MPITIITKTIQKVLKLRRLRSKKDKKKKFLTPGGRWKINEYFATIRKANVDNNFETISMIRNIFPIDIRITVLDM